MKADQVVKLLNQSFKVQDIKHKIFEDLKDHEGNAKLLKHIRMYLPNEVVEGQFG